VTAANISTQSPEPDCYPLSGPQELWYSGDLGDEAGFFDPRFILAAAWRVTGRIDLAALQGALDDVVARHEILRTLVVRDAPTPHQRVHPPLPVPFEVRDLSGAGADRESAAEALLTECELGTLSPRELPLLRAVLGRFDDTDAVLALMSHHTASDEWSLQVLMRDVATFYAARTGSRPLTPRPAVQYREFSAWQQGAAHGPHADQARDYWRRQLRGARIFAAPTDRRAPEAHTEPYSAYRFVVDAGALIKLAESCAATASDALIAAFNVFAHHVSGSAEPALDTLTSGRSAGGFDGSVGALMNFVVLRTDLSGCAGFRDVLERTRDTCTEAIAHEIPIQHIEDELPALMEPNEAPLMTNSILGIFIAPFDESELRLADSSREVLHGPGSAPIGPWIPHGVAWALTLAPTGHVHGCVQYNREELDETTVADWAATYARIVARAGTEPAVAWESL
jgi:hypothetical protein